LHNDEFTWDELLLLGFYDYYFYFCKFRDGDLYARDLDIPPVFHEFPENLGVLPHVPPCAFPHSCAPSSLKLGGTLDKLIDNILKLVGHWKLIKNNMKRFITMPSR
jgi:hypothetical protein